MKANWEIFNGKEVDSFKFYRIPQILVTDERFKYVSYGVKILYGLFLHRGGLSNKNDWRDELGRIFISYSVLEVMKDMNCSKVTDIKMISELEKAGLLEKKRRGLGLANVNYLKKFIAECVITYYQIPSASTTTIMKQCDLKKNPKETISRELTVKS